MQQDEYRIVGGQVLGGRTYTLEEYPDLWENKTPLLYPHLHIAHSQIPFIDPERHIDPERLKHFITANAIDAVHFPVEHFPWIEDFEVILWAKLWNRDEKESQLTYQTYFFSPSRGFLARPGGFRGYTSQELSQDGFQMPTGDFPMPYYDFGQGWAILIAEQNEFVYILQGSFEEVIKKQGYYTWFKVEKGRYTRQWEQAIQLAKYFGTEVTG